MALESLHKLERLASTCYSLDTNSLWLLMAKKATNVSPSLLSKGRSLIKMANFCGLYYPGESWDLSVEDSLLKKSLLFFDKVYAVVPEVFSVDWQDVQPYEELEPFLRDLRPHKLEAELETLENIRTGKVRLSPEQKGE